MIKANGKILKKTYCSHCFSIITWDNINDEKDSMGHRTIVCPYCGFNENIEDEIIVIETDIIESPKAYINNIAYQTTQAALTALKDGDSFVLEEDLIVPTLSIPEVNLNLNGHTLTTENSIVVKGKTQLSNGTIITTGTKDSIVTDKDSEITLTNMIITSKRNGIGAKSGKITLNNSNVTAQEAAILIIDNGVVEINGGKYVTNDNGAIMTNGTKGRGQNTIIINRGIFTGNISSSGYLAHVVYLANNDNLIVKGGTFNVENGSAFVVRGGYLNIEPSVIINVSGNAEGKVGDGAQLVPAGHDIVVDYKSKYPAVDSINIEAPNRDIFIIK